MEKSFEEILKEVVLKGIELAEKTGEFALEQAPELLQEFYTWHLYSWIFWLVFWVLFLITCVIICKYSFNKMEEDYDEAFVFLTTMSGLFSLGGIIGIPICIYNIIFISVAPKLYLIEYFIK